MDNTSAIYSAIKGYSSSRDSARLVHLFQCVLTSLNATVWLEYVPSAANPSDAPSRADFELLAGLGARFCEPCFPSASMLDEPMLAWQRARGSGTMYSH